MLIADIELDKTRPIIEDVRTKVFTLFATLPFILTATSRSTNMSLMKKFGWSRTGIKSYTRKRKATPYLSTRIQITPSRKTSTSPLCRAAPFARGLACSTWIVLIVLRTCRSLVRSCHQSCAVASSELRPSRVEVPARAGNYTVIIPYQHIFELHWWTFICRQSRQARLNQHTYFVLKGLKVMLFFIEYTFRLHCI